MKKTACFNRYSVILSCVLSVFFIGCASKQHDIQCPKVENSCSKCWDSIKAEGKSAGMYVGEGVDAFIVYMKQAEKYLEMKIVEWKVSNPELVEAAEKKLEVIRAKLREYEKRISVAL